MDFMVKALCYEEYMSAESIALGLLMHFDPALYYIRNQTLGYVMWQVLLALT